MLISEKDTYPLRIADGTLHSSGLDTIRQKLGLAKQVEHNVPNDDEALGRIVCVHVALVFVELHVQAPMKLVLNGPILSHEAECSKEVYVALSDPKVWLFTCGSEHPELAIYGIERLGGV